MIHNYHNIQEHMEIQTQIKEHRNLWQHHDDSYTHITSQSQPQSSDPTLWVPKPRKLGFLRKDSTMTMFDPHQTSPDQDSAWCQTLLTKKNKYRLVMTLYSPIVFLWTDPTDSELQTLKIEIQWEDELCRIELFCTMTMLIFIKPVQA